MRPVEIRQPERHTGDPQKIQEILGKPLSAARDEAAERATMERRRMLIRRALEGKDGKSKTKEYAKKVCSSKRAYNISP